MGSHGHVAEGNAIIIRHIMVCGIGNSWGGVVAYSTNNGVYLSGGGRFFAGKWSFRFGTGVWFGFLVLVHIGVFFWFSDVVFEGFVEGSAGVGAGGVIQ